MKGSLNVIVEDALSAAVMRHLLREAGYTGHPIVLTAQGNTWIRKNLEKYKGASRVVPHIVLVDLDRYPCPPALFDDWQVRALPLTMLLRIAVREVEAWLMADRRGIADFLEVAVEKIPFHPETLEDPKQTLFALIRKSRRRRLAIEMLPEPGAHIGPLYNDRMVDFALNFWQVETATSQAPSLNRSLFRIKEFLKRARPMSLI